MGVGISTCARRGHGRERFFEKVGNELKALTDKGS
jgi:hypothetical protein